MYKNYVKHVLVHMNNDRRNKIMVIDTLERQRKNKTKQKWKEIYIIIYGYNFGEEKYSSFSVFLIYVEARWPHGQCAQFRIERFGFELWPGDIVLFSWARHLTPDSASLSYSTQLYAG